MEPLAFARRTLPNAHSVSSADDVAAREPEIEALEPWELADQRADEKTHAAIPAVEPRIAQSARLVTAVLGIVAADLAAEPVAAEKAVLAAEVLDIEASDIAVQSRLGFEHSPA